MSPRDFPKPLIKLMTSVMITIAEGISFSAYKGGNDINVNFTGFYQIILSVAVLGILITAPLGAIGMDFT